MNAEIKALACELPATTGVPLSRWSCAELAREVIDRKAWWRPSRRATVWRMLHQTPSGRGSTVRGSSLVTRISRPRRRWCWTSTPASSRAKPLANGEYVISSRREDLHPGPLPLPPDPAAGTGPADARRARVRPGRRAGLPGRL